MQQPRASLQYSQRPSWDLAQALVPPTVFSVVGRSPSQTREGGVKQRQLRCLEQATA